MDGFAPCSEAPAGPSMEGGPRGKDGARGLDNDTRGCKRSPPACSPRHIEERVVLRDGKTDALLFRPPEMGRTNSSCGAERGDGCGGDGRGGIVLVGCPETGCCGGGQLTTNALGSLGAKLASEGFLSLLIVAEPSEGEEAEDGHGVKTSLAAIKLAVLDLKSRGCNRVAGFSYCSGDKALAAGASVESVLDAAAMIFPRSDEWIMGEDLPQTPLLYILPQGPVGQKQTRSILNTTTKIVRRLHQIESQGTLTRTSSAADMRERLLGREIEQELSSWLLCHLSHQTGDWDVARRYSSTPQYCHWWPECEESPGDHKFHNEGLARWEAARSLWRTPRNPRPPSPPHIPYDVLLEGLTSTQAPFVLPRRVPLPEVVETLSDLWVP